MNAAAVILVLLTGQGFWFGGAQGEASFAWAIDKPVPSVVVWDLMADQMHLAGGRVEMPQGRDPAVVRITTSPVRVRTTVKLLYVLRSVPDDKELSRGETNIELFPKDMLEGMDRLVDGKRLVVLDDPEGLPLLLTAHKIPHQAVAEAGDLPIGRTDIILVGTGRLHAEGFDQAGLLSQAQAGASVLVFNQPEPKVLVGYPLELRRNAAGNLGNALEFRDKHPLLRGFRKKDLQTLVDRAAELHVLQLPADEPALEMIYWPREAPGKQPVPINALLVTKAVGEGRIVLCQIPLEDFARDPLSQLLLANAIDYLVTRPEPTPRPSERPKSLPLVPTIVPNILVP